MQGQGRPAEAQIINSSQRSVTMTIRVMSEEDPAGFGVEIRCRLNRHDVPPRLFHRLW